MVVFCRFWRTIIDKEWNCPSHDTGGQPCQGGPKIRKHSKGPQKGKEFFVGRTHWTNDSKVSHKYVPIPAHIDEGELRKLVSGEKLKGGTNTRTCARLLAPRNGGGMNNCGEKIVESDMLTHAHHT